MRIRKARVLAGIAPLVLAGLAMAIPATAASAAPAHATAHTQTAGTTTVPYVVFDPASAAIQEIRERGLVPIVRGPISNAFVNTQSPDPGNTVAVGSTVTIVTISGPTP